MLSQLNLPQWGIVLIALYGIKEPYNYCQKLYREVPMASSHIRNILVLMEADGFIMRTRESKIRRITLTVKGRQIAEDVIKLKQDMDKNPSIFPENDPIQIAKPY